MARTMKPAQVNHVAEVVDLQPGSQVAGVVELEPGIAEQPPVDQSDAPDEGVSADDQHGTEEQPAAGSRSRGPALNRVELIGRIAKAPDLRYSQSGMGVAYFRVATNGREDKDTEFHQCTAFGKTAEFIAQYLSTGRLVYLDGRLQTRTYDDPDGVRRWATTIVINRLQALDSRRQSDQAEQ